MLDEGIQKHLDKLEQDLLDIKYVTKVDYDLTGYQDGINAPIILVDYDIPFDIEVGQWFKEKDRLKKLVIKTIEDNGVKVELDEFEDNDTYFYIVSYHTTWEQKDKKVEDYEFKNTQYDEKEQSYLDKIYNDLQDGYEYGEDMFNVRFPMFWRVLYKVEDNGKEYIAWRYYGSSAKKDTIENLKWVLDNIFKLTPTEFLNKYIRNDKSKVEESKKEEAKFKDKVKAIKKSLKKNDKRLSDETAQKSAERIAGSMIKKEDKARYYDNVKINYECKECGEKFSHTESVSQKELEELEYSTPDWVPDCPNCDTNKWVEMENYQILTDDELKSLFKNKKIENNTNEDELEVLANDIIDFMGADMGTWFDEIQGNEEEIFYDTLSILESGDEIQLQILVNNIAEAEIDEETAKECGIKSSNNLIERINKVITNKKEESLSSGWKPEADLYIRQINEISDNLGIAKNEIQKEGDSIKFRYNGKVYFAKPVAMSQVDVFDDNHKQIGWGVLTDRIKEEVFTDYITDKKFIYQLVGGEYAGEYTKEELDKLNLINGNTGENLGRREELKNQPILKGYLGPMWNGVKDGNAVIRYETQEVYNMLSESEKLNESKEEDYWDAKELARDGFVALLKFNFGIDFNGNNYIITKDAYDKKRFYAKSDKEAIEFYNKWKDAERNAFGDYILEEVKQYKFDGTEIFPKRIKARGGYVFTKVNDGTKENDFVPVYINDSGSETLMFQDDFNRCEILEEAEIVDRPEDILEAEEDIESKSTEDVIDNKEESETILDLLQDRIGQQIEVGRLNAILQSVFGMYNKTFILPTDLYNMDLNETQELTVFDDEDEYIIYFDIIDIDNGIIEITGVDLL